MLGLYLLIVALFLVIMLCDICLANILSTNLWFNSLDIYYSRNFSYYRIALAKIHRV
jgi:hypothetical protein